MFPLADLNTLCQRQNCKPSWNFFKQGLAHQSQHRAELTVANVTVQGDWAPTKIESKNSAAIAYMHASSLSCNENRAAVTPVLILADVDNSLDISTRLNDEHPGACFVAFCGRSFHARSVPANARMYRASSSVKNAAEMAMSFHACTVVREAVHFHSVTRVLVVSRDAALEELVCQLKSMFTELDVAFITY